LAALIRGFRAPTISQKSPKFGRKAFSAAPPISACESPRTTKLYDRTGDEITLDEVERISI